MIVHSCKIITVVYYIFYFEYNIIINLRIYRKNNILIFRRTRYNTLCIFFYFFFFGPYNIFKCVCVFFYPYNITLVYEYKNVNAVNFHAFVMFYLNNVIFGSLRISYIILYYTINVGISRITPLVSIDKVYGVKMRDFN